ncbi:MULTISPECIES: enhanced intracellular survival protein Eis [Listeria]|uniref:GNAT family N-acetyltransferase n=1 Tax=Listeria TaxID=1637 RepID=UPI000B58A5CD|nr:MULTISPECIES: GNAT family N-acetyltransferase [Listeria]
MEIRKIAEEEIHQIKRLRDYAFRTPGGGGEEDFLFWMERATRLGAFSDGKLSAQVMTYPLDVSFLGQKIKMGGVAYVATFPENRRSGFIRALMTASLNEMKELGQLVSYLHPFDIPFYQKFGFDLVANEVSVSLKLKNLKRRSSGRGEIVRTSANQPDFSDVRAVYETYATNHHGMLVRGDDWWGRLSRRGYTNEVALFRDEQNEPRGYLLYGFKGSEMLVHELIALDFAAECELWAFISSHDSMFETVQATHFGTPAEVALALPNVTGLKMETEFNWMARIVEVEAFLNAISFQTAEKVYVEIQNDVADFNHGIFEIGDKIRRVESAPNDLLLQTDIGTFSQMMFGFMRPKELAYYGKMTASDKVLAIFEAAIPNVKPRFYDGF